MSSGETLHAVWDGRFQPPHRGHLAVIARILEQFDLPLVVLIIQSEEAASDDRYSQEVNRHHLAARNPLTLWERRRLLQLALADEVHGGRVEILGIPRPDLHWPLARSFYPARRFICLTGKDEYERRKATFWAGLGEETRLVDVSGIAAISATEVKEAIKCRGGWRDLLPTACLEYFEAIGGPARFAAAAL